MRKTVKLKDFLIAFVVGRLVEITRPKYCLEKLRCSTSQKHVEKRA